MIGLIVKRKSAGLTQNELSELIGVKQSTLANWEAGTRSPNVTMLKQLAAALHCTVDELLQEETEVK